MPMFPSTEKTFCQSPVCTTEETASGVDALTVEVASILPRLTLRVARALVVARAGHCNETQNHVIKNFKSKPIS